VSIGLLGLLDDVVAITKVAAASLDDIAAQATKAGVKAAGVVVDDAAVTPRYVVGFASERELPIVWKIALGSLRNKLLILLPAALLLSAFAPGLLTPLLMIGGVYLCYEGVEKLYHALSRHGAEAHEARVGSVAFNPVSLEDEKVASAIKTDFILSAEIMTITLAAVPAGSIWMQAAVLAAVGVGITAGVYGAVALIVKADDAGVSLARYPGLTPLSALVRVFGRALVVGMPHFLIALSAVGTAAMIWVGGGIIVHGLEHYGVEQIDHAIDTAAELAARALPPLAAVVDWIVTAALSGAVGLIVGVIAIPVSSHVIAPLWRGLKGILRSKQPA
jgi:uncharacterized protein